MTRRAGRARAEPGRSGTTSVGAGMTSLLQRFFNVRRGEVAPILMAALYFFCILTR
jgi:hypothetical protein